MQNLSEQYKQINVNAKTIFVTPSIQRTRSHNSYLYLLYKEIIEENEFEVQSLRVAEFPKLILDRLKGNSSILHHHWFGFHDLKSLMIIFWTLFWMILYKLLGGKIVWTVHNRVPHNQSYVKINLYLRSFFANMVNKIHVHCDRAIEIMQPILKVNASKFFIIEHPLYEVNIISKNEAIEALIQKYSIANKYFDKNKKVFMVFGVINRYKGISNIIEVFNTLNEKEDYTLLIIGLCKDKILESEVMELSKSNNNIVVINQLIPEEDIDLFFNATDNIVFNYKDILTSGGVALAMSYQKKIILPRMGCLSDIDYDNCIYFDSLNKETIIKVLT